MSDKIVVKIDGELQEIVPGYLENRHRDLVAIREALASDNLEPIRTMGHKMKGSGAGYGFALITDIGRALEEAAKKGDRGCIEDKVTQLEDYLNRVDIQYNN